MTANHEIPVCISPSMRTRLAIYCVSGAISGLVVAPLIKLGMLVMEAVLSRKTLTDFLRFWSPLEREFWEYFLAEPASYIGPTISGLIFGAMTTITSQRLRHPIFVASLWASILATPTLVIHFFFPLPDPVDSAVIIAGTATIGAVYGFILGLLARFLERSVAKRNRFRAELTTPLER